MAQIKTSIHGERFGLGANDELISNNKVLALSAAQGEAVAGSGAALETYGNGIVNRTVVTLTDRTLALTDEAGVVAYVGSKILDLPAGNINILGSTCDLTVSKDAAGVDDDFNGDFSVGTVTASNNATLATTEQNIIPTTAFPEAVSGATTAKGKSTDIVVLDGTATAVDVFLNMLVDDADQNVTGTATNLVVNGTVTITWINLGDV